jgi:multidrug efflux system outer membrane protein
MKPLSRFALSALMAGLSACTLVGPNYQVPEKAAINDPHTQQAFDLAGNSELAAGELPQDWWRLYQDPMLDQLVTHALQSNTDLRLAYHNLRQAYEGYRMAENANEVNFGASAAAGRGQLSSEALALTEQLPVMNLGDAEVSVGYQLDLFGKLKRATEAAAADTEATRAAMDAARISIVAQVVHSYVESCHATEELKIAQTSLSIQQRQLDVVQRLLHAGRGNEIDVARANAQTEALRATLPPFASKKAASLYQLAALLGRTPGDLPPGVADCHHAPQLDGPIPVGDGAQLLKRRPDVRQAERQLAAATAQIGVATAELYPEISLGANFGYTGMLEHMGEAITRRWSLMPEISWHFPTQVDRARIRAREAGADAALARFDGVVLNALRETQTHLATYANDLQRNRALRQARDAAQTAAEYNRRLYQEGRLTYLDSLDAERTLASSEAVLAESEAKLSEDQVRLFLSLGGGWKGQETKVDAAPMPAPAQPR